MGGLEANTIYQFPSQFVNDTFVYGYFIGSGRVGKSHIYQFPNQSVNDNIVYGASIGAGRVRK